MNHNNYCVPSQLSNSKKKDNVSLAWGLFISDSTGTTPPPPFLPWPHLGLAWPVTEVPWPWQLDLNACHRLCFTMFTQLQALETKPTSTTHVAYCG